VAWWGKSLILLAAAAGFAWAAWDLYPQRPVLQAPTGLHMDVSGKGRHPLTGLNETFTPTCDPSCKVTSSGGPDDTVVTLPWKPVATTGRWSVELASTTPAVRRCIGSTVRSPTSRRPGTP
jgi:hypothetical protein